MTPAEQARANFEEARQALDTFLADDENFKKISDAAALMVASIQKGGKVISCGNGGSMSDAMHFAEELSGRFRDDRKALPAVSISDPTHLSCVANDYGYEFVFFIRYSLVLAQNKCSGTSPAALTRIKHLKSLFNQKKLNPEI